MTSAQIIIIIVNIFLIYIMKTLIVLSVFILNKTVLLLTISYVRFRK